MAQSPDWPHGSLWEKYEDISYSLRVCHGRAMIALAPFRCVNALVFRAAEARLGVVSFRHLDCVTCVSYTPYKTGEGVR